MKRTEPPSQPPPFVTVVIRSYRRIPAMLELLAACRAQEYPAFEILVVEQTGPERETHRAALDAAQADPRVRVLEVPPLGPAGARNASTPIDRPISDSGNPMPGAGNSIATKG